MAVTPLVRGETATKPFAAAELQRYLTQMYPGEPPPPRVEVAVDRTMHGFSIAREDGVVRIRGADDFMALCGAYHLLDLLGCRFLAPQFDHYRGAGEVVAGRRSADIDLPLPVARNPKLKFRKLYVEEGISHDTENLKQLVEWMPKVGYNTLVVPTDYGGRGRVRWDNWREQLTPELRKRGITIEVGGHGYENFINASMEGGKLFERHPEWFARDEKGVPQKQKRYVFCTSNARAVEYVTGNVIAYL